MMMLIRSITCEHRCESSSLSVSTESSFSPVSLQKYPVTADTAADVSSFSTARCIQRDTQIGWHRSFAATTTTATASPAEASCRTLLCTFACSLVISTAKCKMPLMGKRAALTLTVSVTLWPTRKKREERRYRRYLCLWALRIHRHQAAEVEVEVEVPSTIAAAADASIQSSVSRRRSAGLSELLSLPFFSALISPTPLLWHCTHTFKCVPLMCHRFLDRCVCVCVCVCVLMITFFSIVCSINPCSLTLYQLLPHWLMTPVNWCFLLLLFPIHATTTWSASHHDSDIVNLALLVFKVCPLFTLLSEAKDRFIFSC